MKKIFSKIIISFVLFSFIIPVSFKAEKISAAGEWYFTKTNDLLYNFSSGAVTFISATSSADCTEKRNATPSVAKYTLGPCTEKVQAPEGEGWGYNVDTKVAPVLANNPIGFKTEQDCDTNRGAYLDSDIHKNDTFFVSISPCSYKKNINNDGVVLVDGKIGATENKSRYNLLAPIGKIKCMDWSESSNKVGADGEPECIDNNIGTYLNFIFKFGIGLSAAMAVVMLIIYGVVYMGDESVFSKTEAKKKMFGAVVGLLIALGGWVLLNSINRDLTGATGFKIDQANVIISKEDTSTGSSTSLCLPTNPPDPNSATGSTVKLSNEITNEYIPERNKINGISTGTKLLITAQTAVEGFYKGTKSYRTNNPGNIGNTDDGSTKSYPTLKEGIEAQVRIATNVANGTSPSYKIGSKPACALGNETYNGYLYQYLRIYATGARTSNAYLNVVIGHFKSNGKTITAKTTMSEIYNMN